MSWAHRCVTPRERGGDTPDPDLTVPENLLTYAWYFGLQGRETESRALDFGTSHARGAREAEGE